MASLGICGNIEWFRPRGANRSTLMEFDEANLAAAAFLFERGRGVPLEKSQLDEIERAGLAEIDPSILADQIATHLRTSPNVAPNDRASAYWALGKKHDRHLIPFFREALTKEVNCDICVAYQIMIALDNLGEPVFEPSRTSRSFDEDVLNKRDAMKYIKRA